MKEEYALREVEVKENAVGDVKFETRTAAVKGLLVGAAIIGGCWAGVGLYRHFRGRKARKEIEESREEITD